MCMKLALYPIPRLLPHIRSNTLFTILAEELCHMIWEIQDEVLVNYKVLEVLQNIDPSLTLDRLGYLQK